MIFIRFLEAGSNGKKVPLTFFQDFLALVKRYKARFCKGFFLVALSNILYIVNPLLFKSAIGQMPAVADLGYLLKWAALLLVTALIASYLKYLMRYEFISISRDAEKELRDKLFTKLQAQSRHFYDRHDVGELVSRLSSDITAYRDVLGPGVMYPLFFITLVLPGIAALLYLSTPLGLIALFPLSLIPLINLAFKKVLYKFSKKIQETLAEMSSFSQESYSGIRIVKAYCMTDHLEKVFYSLCKKLSSFNFRYEMIASIENPLFTFLIRGTTIFLTLAASFLVHQSEQSLSAADFISFMWIQSYISMPVLMLAWIMPIYQKGRASYDRIKELYEEPIEVKSAEENDLRIPKNASIELCNLSFSYPGKAKPALKNINLMVQPGEFIGITGAVGSGKSTLFHLLTRAYEVKEGMIKIAGKEIHEYPQEACHESIVIVEQTPFLFSKSILENVRFGKQSASINEIEKVSKMAELHGSILDFPDQYETVIGERGVTLSGGQKQRLAIARALLVDRSILLLDEIFSAVDAETERRIFSSLQGFFKDKTVLMISSRSSVLEKADRVLVFEEGQIIEEGSPGMLKGQKSRFNALYELQNM